jgi:anaerobic selenocysteine-containing dehydrogenase
MQQDNSSSSAGVKSTCRICYNSCGVLIRMENGKPVKVSGEKSHPISKGKLCKRGLAILEMFNHPDRLKHPLKRVGRRGEGKWKKISWNEALDTTANRLIESRDRYGAESVIFIRGGSKGMSDDYLLRFANLFGSPNFSSAAPICYSPCYLSSIFTYGYWAYPDFDYPPDCILVWGFNPEVTHPPVYNEIRQALKKKSKLIVIDPAGSRLAESARLWLKPKPGSDAALALGILNVILSKGLYDQCFTDKWAVGLNRLKDHVAKYPLERVETLTWVPHRQIQLAAELFASAKNGCIAWGNALETNQNSFNACRAIAMIRAVTGNLGVPGGEVKWSDLGELNRRSPGLVLSNHLDDAVRAQGLGAMAGLLPNFHHSPHYFFQKAVIEGKPYKIRTAYIQGANLITSKPNAFKTFEALKSLDFSVVTDFFMMPTAMLADIVLPAATYLEYDSVEQPWHWPIASVQQKVTSYAQARSNEQILSELAGRLGFHDEVFGNLETFLDSFLKPAGITFDEFRNIGTITSTKCYRHFENTGFETPSGKVELYSERLKDWGFDPLPEYRDVQAESSKDLSDGREYPLILTSRKQESFYRSYGIQIDALRRSCPDPLVRMHPDTAEKLNINEGDWAIIATKNGTIRQRVRLDNRLDPRIIMAAYGWWFPEKKENALFGWEESNLNVLTDGSESWNPELGTPNLRGICCRVTKENGNT